MLILVSLIDGNNLNGSLPTEILLLTELTKLHVKNNHLTGTIFSGIHKLDKLEVLWLGGYN